MTYKEPTNLYHLIETVEEIEEICLEILKNETFVTVDVEFFNAKPETNYQDTNNIDFCDDDFFQNSHQEKDCNLNPCNFQNNVTKISNSLFSKSEKKWHLSLIQICSPVLQKVFIFDIDFKGQKNNLSNLKNLLVSKSLTKVFHDHRQDFWAILGCLDVEIQNIFDTQIADMFLSFSSCNRSYASVVSDFVCIKIDKKCQNDDWSKRPLDLDQLNYAALDVIHLVPVYEKILKKLIELERFEWKKEYMDWFFWNRKIEKHKVFQLLTKFNICLKKSRFNFPCFLRLEKLIFLFENFSKISQQNLHLIKNIIESKKISQKKLENIFIELGTEVKETKEFKNFFNEILKICQESSGLLSKKDNQDSLKQEISSDFQLILYQVFSQENGKNFKKNSKNENCSFKDKDFKEIIDEECFFFESQSKTKFEEEIKKVPQGQCNKKIKEKFEIFLGISKKMQTSKIDLNFEFSHAFLILKYILRKESQKNKICSGVIAEKHDILEFLQFFQSENFSLKDKNNSPEKEFFGNCFENEIEHIKTNFLSEQDFENFNRNPLEKGFRFQIFGQKAKSFLNGELKLFFNLQKKEFDFSHELETNKV